MANVLTYIKFDLKSVYNISNLMMGNNTVTVVYFHLPYRVPGERYAIAPDENTKTSVEAIIDTIKNPRLSFHVMTLDNYDPKWTSIPEFEILEVANSKVLGEFDSVAFPCTIEDFPCTIKDGRAGRAEHAKIKKAISKIASDYGASCPPVTYPLETTSLIKCQRQLVSSFPTTMNIPGLKDRDPFFDKRMAMYDQSIVKTKGGAQNIRLVEEQVRDLELSFRNGTHASAGIERDGRWFVENHPVYGSYISVIDNAKSLFDNHPYYQYLLQD